jgi:hypothetical protein
MAKQKKGTGKRMGPGRPAVVVDKVRQRLFNKHFDDWYSADDIWKQNRDCISKRTAQRLVKDFQTKLDWRRSPPARRERSDGARRWVLEVLRRVVDERPAAYLDEIQRELREVYTSRVSHATLWGTTIASARSMKLQGWDSTWRFFLRLRPEATDPQSEWLWELQPPRTRRGATDK